MVAAVRQGASLREVARRFRVRVATASLWFHRAGQQHLERVAWRKWRALTRDPASRSSLKAQSSTELGSR